MALKKTSVSTATALGGVGLLCDNRCLLQQLQQPFTVNLMLLLASGHYAVLLFVRPPYSPL